MYDVAIIGGGPAAIFAAYEFVMKYPKLKLVMLEAGNAIDKRFCPLAAKKVDHCINCKPCSIMRGFGGAGAFSDGKYNFTTEFGGWLNEYLPEEKPKLEHAEVWSEGNYVMYAILDDDNREAVYKAFTGCFEG